MLYVTIAYLLVWLAMLAYVVRLGIENRRLCRMAQTLAARSQADQPVRQKAA
jgi:hypothetical protein